MLHWFTDKAGGLKGLKGEIYLEKDATPIFSKANDCHLSSIFRSQ